MSGQSYAPSQFPTPGLAGYSAPSVAPACLEVTLVPAVSGSGGMILSFNGDGTVSPCDPTQPGYEFAGVSMGAFTAGETFQAVHSGLMTDSSWSWSPQMPIFASPGGLMTQAVPTSGILHRMATAMSATAIIVSPRSSVLRQ